MELASDEWIGTNLTKKEVGQGCVMQRFQKERTEQAKTRLLGVGKGQSRENEGKWSYVMQSLII